MTDKILTIKKLKNGFLINDDRVAANLQQLYKEIRLAFEINERMHGKKKPSTDVVNQIVKAPYKHVRTYTTMKDVDEIKKAKLN